MLYNYLSKIEGACISVHMVGTLFRFGIGSLKSSNSVRNIKTAEFIQKNRNQFASNENGLHHLVEVRILRLFLYIYKSIKHYNYLLLLLLSFPLSIDQ